MDVKRIKVKSCGYVHCRSCFYTAQDIIQQYSEYDFEVGINKLYGEIDSGVWAISYLLSMYKYKPKDFMLFSSTNIYVNETIMSLNDISQLSCYMDASHPIFSSKKSIRELVEKGISTSKLRCSSENIKTLFGIDNDRFERPLKETGNEIFKSMAAIGYSFDKELFCFPWLSEQRFDYYKNNITQVLNTLECLNRIVIFPIGKYGIISN